MWSGIFGNTHPVEVEVGAGTGSFLLPAAAAAPAVNYFGIERSLGRVCRVESAAAARGLANLRVINADAACVIGTLVPDASVHAYHVYFPDPWWKRRHHRRRLFTAAFAAALQRTLVSGGRICLATDVDETFASILATIAAHTDLRLRADLEPVRPRQTAFERKGLARGATIKEAVFVRPGAGGVGEPRTRYSSSAAPMTPAESPS